MNIWKKISGFLKRKIVMKNYYSDLRYRVDSYQKRFPHSPRRTAVRLIWWDFKSLFKRHGIKKKKRLEDDKVEYELELDEGNVNVGFLLRGGLGDFLVAANFFHYFLEKYNDENMILDVYVRKSLPSAYSIFGKEPPIEIHSIRPEEGYEKHFREYDLFVDLCRYPDIKRRNFKKLAEMQPELIEYVSICEQFRSEYNRFYKSPGITEGQSAKMEAIRGRKRIQQPDVYGFLGVTEEYKFPIQLCEDADECLERLGIGNRPFILLHRGVDASLYSESIKLWPKRYYDILTSLIKKKYPDILLVQIGVSEIRCPAMEGIDINLVEKTTLEDIKILLAKATLLIDGEGGFAHMRHALKAGTSIVMFGPTSEDFFGYSENINLRGNGCSTWCEWATYFWQEGCPRGERIAPCMASIIPETVYSAVDKCLSERKK